MNTDIITDFSTMFSSFLIDLRDIKTETKVTTDKQNIVTIFEEILGGKSDARDEIHRVIHPSTKAQYEQGI